MGPVYINIRLGHVERPSEMLQANALIDLGGLFTTVPPAIAKNLGLPKVAQRLIRTWSGTSQIDEYYGLLEYENRRSVVSFLIGEEPTVAVGRIALTSLGLVFDPETGELKPQDFLLLVGSQVA